MWVHFKFLTVFHSSLYKKLYTVAKAHSVAVTALLPICRGNTTLFAFEKVTVTLLRAVLLYPPKKRLIVRISDVVRITVCGSDFVTLKE
jgi:hypothetical protein